MQKDTIQMVGRVKEVIPGGRYKVTLENNADIIAHASGKMRMYKIGIFAGDTVTVEMSTYDLTKGRIVLRNK